MPHRSLTHLYKDEFTVYSLAKFQQDLLAGIHDNARNRMQRGGLVQAIGSSSRQKDEAVSSVSFIL